MISKSKSGQTFEQGAAILFISGIFVKIIGAFFKIPLSSDYCLGDIGFGYFSSVYDIYLPIYALATTGIPSSISRIISEYLAEKDNKNAEIAFNFFKKIMFIFGAIGTLVLLLVAFPFVKLTDDTGNTLYTYILMCPAVLFSFFSSPLRGFSEGNRNMIPTAISNIIDAFSKILIGFSSAFITIKLTGNFALSSAAAIGGIALGTVISYIFLNIYNSRYYKREKSNIVTEISNKLLLNKLYKICIPIVITSFSINIFPFIDSLTVRPVLSGILDSQNNILSIIDANYISDFTEEIPTLLYGIKSKAYTIFNLVPVFATFIASSALPSVTSKLTSGDYKDASKTINSALKFSAVISFPLGCGLLFIGTPIMKLLFGDSSFYLGGKMLSIYGIAALFAGMIMVIISVLQALGKQNKVLLNMIIGLAFKLILNMVLVSIPSVNIYGAAWSTVAGLGYIFFSNFICLVRENRIKINLFSSIFKPLISAFACGISAYLISKMNDNMPFTILSILVAGIVYLIFLCLFKTFSLKELKELIAKND